MGRPPGSWPPPSTTRPSRGCGPSCSTPWPTCGPGTTWCCARGRQPRRDQPAGRRPGQPAAGPPGRAAGDRGGRHRPGGVFAALYGTVALLPDDLRATVRGFVVNRLRGRPRAAGRRLRRPGAAVRRPHAGRAPAPGRGRHRQRGLPGAGPGRPRTGGGRRRARRRRCAGPGCPTPGTSTRCGWRRGSGCGGSGRRRSWAGPTWWCCPGRRTTRGDLAWFRRTGLAAAVERSDAAVLAVCAGLQMVGDRIDDPDGVEGRPGTGKGLGWVPVATEFGGDKVLDRPAGRVAEPGAGRGRGRLPHPPRAGAGRGRAAPWLVAEGGEVLGWSRRPGGGTTLHGLFERDGFRARRCGGWPAGRGRQIAHGRRLRRRPPRPPGPHRRCAGGAPGPERCSPSSPRAPVTAGAPGGPGPSHRGRRLDAVAPGGAGEPLAPGEVAWRGPRR